MLLQTLLALLALAVMTAGVAVAIRYITKWRRRIEQTDPERDEKAEKDRQRAIFVTKNLKTRVWTMPRRPGPAEVKDGEQEDTNGANLAPDSSGAADGHQAAEESSARSSAPPSFVSTASPRSPSRGGSDVLIVNRSIINNNNNNDDNLDNSNHSSSSSSSEGELLDSATSSDVTASSSTTSSRYGLDLEAGCGGCDQSARSGRGSASHQLSSSALSLHNGDAECAICSRTFRHNRDLVCDSNNTSCRHVFHASCMKRWLLLNPNCPLCRKEYLLHFAPKWRAAPLPAPLVLLPPVPKLPESGASPRRSSPVTDSSAVALQGDDAAVETRHTASFVATKGSPIAAPPVSADFLPSEERQQHPVATEV